ncbi:hypothetical protein KAR48_18685 [bacterium]|nr:hypothetical protein [bacterium]
MMSKRLMRIYQAILFCLVLTGSVRADIPSAFVDIGYGARPMGMGGAYVALASDAYGVFWNPAGLPYVRGWQVSTMYAKQFNIVQYYLLTGARHFGDVGVGGAVLSAGDEVWRETTALLSGGVKLDRFGAVFKGMSIGATFKMRTVSFGNNPDGGELQIQGSGTGYGLDLGFRWKFARRWTMGVLYRDFLNNVNYNNRTRDVNYGESVPSSLVMGTAFLARPNLVFVLDWDKALTRQMQDRVLLGMEWRLFKLLFVRCGWSQSLGADPMRKFNWGLGVQYFKRKFGIRLDFAYQTYFLASTPRVSTSIWF